MSAVPPKISPSSIPTENFWTDPTVRVITVEEAWSQAFGQFTYWSPKYVNEALRNARRLHRIK